MVDGALKYHGGLYGAGVWDLLCHRFFDNVRLLAVNVCIEYVESDLPQEAEAGMPSLGLT